MAMISISSCFETCQAGRRRTGANFKETSKKDSMQAIKLYDRLVEPVALAWMVTIFFMGLLLAAGRQFIAALLMKLYEELILYNPAIN